MTIHRVLASFFLACLLVSLTTAVHAGGMGGSGNAVAFECYAGSGAGPTGTVTLTDDFTARAVTLGALRFVCTPVLSSGWSGSKNPTPIAGCDPTDPVDCGNHLKCYDIRTMGGSASADLTLSDFFFQDALTTAIRPQLLCVGAQRIQ